MLTVGIYWHPALTSIVDQWRYTDESIGCKNVTRMSFSSTETSLFILWMETGCKLGSPEKFENDKLYSNAYHTVKWEREPGIVLDSKELSFLIIY